MYRVNWHKEYGHIQYRKFQQHKITNTMENKQDLQKAGALRLGRSQGYER